MSDDRDLEPRLDGEQAPSTPMENGNGHDLEPCAGVLPTPTNAITPETVVSDSSPDSSLPVWERIPATISRAVDPPPAPVVELSKSDRQFIAAYAAGGGLAEVGRRWAELRGGKPYKSSDAACNSASRKLVEIRRRISESGQELWWEMLGLSASKIAETLAAGMNAVRREAVAVRRDKVVIADGREKIVRDDTIQIVEVGEDHRSRIESAVRAASLRGELYRRPAPDADISSQRIIVRWLCD